MDIQTIEDEYSRLMYLRRQIDFALQSIETKNKFIFENIMSRNNFVEDSVKEDESIFMRDKEFIESEIFKLYAGDKHFINLVENISIIEMTS